MAGAAGLGILLIALMLIGAFRAICKEEKVLTHEDFAGYVPPPAPIRTAYPRAYIRPLATDSCNDAGVCTPATIRETEKQKLLEALDSLRKVQKEWTEPRPLPRKSGCDNWARRADSAADEAAIMVKPLQDSVPGVRHTRAAIEVTRTCADCNPNRDACATLPEEIEHAEAEILGARVVH